MTILRDPSGERLFLEGRLEGLGVPDLIHAICLPRSTGILTLSRVEVSKTIYIKNGQLVFAASNVAEDRLGETLLRDGVIGYAQLETAISYMGGGKRLGSILVELGYLAPEKLVRGLLHQVKEIILSLFPWEGGAYRFVEEPLPTAEVITLNIATSKLILDGIRRINSWPRIVRSVGYSRATYRLTREGRTIAEDLDLGAAEKLILASLERPVCVGDICRSVFLANYDVYQYLWAFRILGIIQQVEADPDAVDADAKDATRGELYDTPITDLLLGLCRKRETGVLYLTRDGEEKSIHVKNGTVVFATSNRPDEGLTTFLLRRGVIGLRDKDEIERRLLSHRRTGTILREMGIVTQDELVRFVKEQLREIVQSVFSWERGEWRFLAGELPSVEDVQLDRPIEEIVLQGLRSVQDWSRIRIGCGDLNKVLHKVAAPPQSVGAFEMGPDESEVLAALDEPRSIAEICKTAAINDHRVGQILWGLQVLGIVECAPVKTSEAARKNATWDVPATESVASASTQGAVSAAATVASPPELVASAAGGERTGAWTRSAGGDEGGAGTTMTAMSTSGFSVKAPDENAEAGLMPEGRESGGTARSERSGVESPHHETSHSEAPGSESPHHETPHSEAPRGESLPHETPHSEALRGENLPHETSRDKTPHGETPRGETAHDEGQSASAPPRTPLEAVGSGVLEEIERFNRRHRELYAVLKGAVGAGAKNFVATSIRRLGPAAADFSGLTPDESGAFGPESLYERVGSLDPGRIRALLESLIDAETETAGLFLDPGTLERLRKRLETATWDLAERS